MSRKNIEFNLSVDTTAINEALARLKQRLESPEVQQQASLILQSAQIASNNLARAFTMMGRQLPEGFYQQLEENVCQHLLEQYQDSVQQHQYQSLFNYVNENLAVVSHWSPPNDLKHNCKYNANSPYLKCAVNPSGHCAYCPHFEPDL